MPAQIVPHIRDLLAIRLKDFVWLHLAIARVKTEIQHLHAATSKPTVIVVLAVRPTAKCVVIVLRPAGSATRE